MFSPLTRLKPHHSAWLTAHPERSQAWLLIMLAEGFDVHHIDDNHANNDPPNLVLMEHVDHMRLHGLGMIRRSNARKKGAEAKRRKPKKMTQEAIRKRRVKAKRAARARWLAYRKSRQRKRRCVDKRPAHSAISRAVQASSDQPQPAVPHE